MPGRIPGPLRTGTYDRGGRAAHSTGFRPAPFYNTRGPLGTRSGRGSEAFGFRSPILRDRSRFIALYHRKAAGNPRTAHAQTLIEAFRDSMISGKSAEGRFVAILALTESGPSFMPAKLHFHEDSIVGIATDPLEPRAGDRSWEPGDAFGDYGFRRELRDSVHYHVPSGGGSFRLHPGSSNQIGHFLTAADIGYYVARTEGELADRVRQLAKSRADHPLLALVRDFLTTGAESDRRLGQAAINTGLQRAMVGHELVKDKGVSGFKDKGVPGFPETSTVAAPVVATPEDVANFLRGRLDLISIDEKKLGNSYQDLLLTWVGYRFGQHMANDRFRSRTTAAWWLEMMLTDTFDLNQVQQGDHAWRTDAQELQRLLQQFRKVQRRRHGKGGAR